MLSHVHHGSPFGSSQTFPANRSPRANTMPSPLPRELLEQIMGDDVLDHRTLASCCRLSKDWVDFVRPRLYRHLVFDFCYSMDDCDVESTETELHYTHRNLALILTLRRDPFLARLVKQVSFKRIETTEQASGLVSTTRGLLSAVLRVCTDVERIDIPSFDVDKSVDYVGQYFNRRDSDDHVPSELVIPYITESATILFWTASYCTRSLTIGDGPYIAPLGEPVTFQPGLEKFSLARLHLYGRGLLDVDEREDFIEALSTGSQETLTSLVLPLDGTFKIDFSTFTLLRHLQLDFSTGTTSDFDQRTLATIPSTLSSLALSGHNLTPATLASLLPSSLLQLRLANTSPAYLLALLQILPPSSKLRLLHAQNSSKQPYSRRHEFRAVEEACVALGVAFEWSLRQV